MLDFGVVLRAGLYQLMPIGTGTSEPAANKKWLNVKGGKGKGKGRGRERAVFKYWASHHVTSSCLSRFDARKLPIHVS